MTLHKIQTNCIGSYVVGLALFLPIFLTACALERWLLSLGLKTPATPLPQLQAVGGLGATILGVVVVATVAFAEETIFRGYLILRLRALTSSAAAAVLISTAVFCLGHGYEGTAGLVTVAFLGLVFALLFLWRRSLAAAMTVHFLPIRSRPRAYDRNDHQPDRRPRRGQAKLL